MSFEKWEKKILKTPGAVERVEEIEEELRLAIQLTALREDAGLSQRELADRIGISQPRIAAIERSSNITLDVLKQYVEGVGGNLEIEVSKGSKKHRLLGAKAKRASNGSKVKKVGRAAPRTPQPSTLSKVSARAKRVS